MLRKDDRTYVRDSDGAIERVNANRVTYVPLPENTKSRHEATREQHDIAKNTEAPT